MVAVPLGTSSYRRRDARTPEISLINVLLEQDPTNQVDGKVYIQRPGMSVFANVGAGAIRGVFRKLGVLGGQYIVVSGTSLYLVSQLGAVTNLGTIPASDLVSIDASSDRVIIVADGTAYSTDGVTIVAVVVPDIDTNPSPISSVCYINGYFILTVQDSQHFFWLAPGDVDPDPLNFASAENAPGNIVGAFRLLDEVWMFCDQGTEILQLSGDLNAPFIPIVGRIYQKGCANRDSVAELDNTLFWVGNDFIVYRAETIPVRISDHSIEERLRLAGASALRAWAMIMTGHTLYALRAGDIGTFVHDVENKNWVRWKTYGQETWQAHLGGQVAGNLIVTGDDTDGILWQLDQTLSNDNGVVMERELTAGLPIIGKSVSCRSFSLKVAVGLGTTGGTVAEPTIAMRYSDDIGNTWSSWLEESLGAEGEFKTKVLWTQLGQMESPGRIFHIRVTDDTLFRVNYARINDDDYL